MRIHSNLGHKAMIHSRISIKFSMRDARRVYKTQLILTRQQSCMPFSKIEYAYREQYDKSEMISFF